MRTSSLVRAFVETTFQSVAKRMTLLVSHVLLLVLSICSTAVAVDASGSTFKLCCHTRDLDDDMNAPQPIYLPTPE